MQRRIGHLLIDCLAPVIRVVDQRVHVVFDQMVALPVQPKWAASFLIDKAMASNVSRHVRNPPECKRLEPWTQHRIEGWVTGALPKHRAEAIGLAVMEHVAPEEGSLIEPGRHTAR